MRSQSVCLRRRHPLARWWHGETLLALAADSGWRYARCEAPAPTTPPDTQSLVDAVVQLAVTKGERSQTRDAFLQLLNREPSSWGTQCLVDAVAQLAVTAKERRHAGKAFPQLMIRKPSLTAKPLVQLDPAGLEPTWHTWADLPNSKLLTTVRRNSTISAWLAAMPRLTQNNRS
jgi:hypothetical protein